MSSNMVHIGGYLAKPEGFAANRLPGAVAAVPAGSVNEVARDFLEDVNFPEYVASLIEGVFQAIVDASVKQMDAYGELLQSVAKTVDQFVQDQVSDGKGRDWLLATYPNLFERVDGSGCLRLRPGVNVARAISRLRFLPVEGELDQLDSGAIEAKLVPAARRRLATSRQQLLATMVMMGVQRSVSGRRRV